MNKLRIIEVNLPCKVSSKQCLIFIESSSGSFQVDDEIALPENIDRPIKLKCKLTDGTEGESLPFDLNLLLNNPRLNLPFYQLPNLENPFGFIQISLSNPLKPQPNPPDLLDIHFFSTGSKTSTSASEPSSGKSPILQIIDGINEELKLSILKHQKLHEIDKQSNSALFQDIKKSKTDFFKEKEDWKNSEKKLLAELKELESSVSSLKYELLKTKNENKALVSENQRLSITGFKKVGKEDSSSSFSETEEKRKYSFNSTSESSDLVRQKDLIIRGLTNELNEAKILNKSILLNRQISKNNNDVEDVVAQKLRVYKVPGMFMKDPEQNYIYNGKKIVMMVKGGQLLCKIGTMFRPFEEFLKSSGVSHKSISHKRFKSLDFSGESGAATPKTKVSSSKVKF